MVGIVKVDTLQNNAGTSSVDMDYVVNGSAKAWNNINGTGTIAIRDSFGISSISDLGTGRYQHSVTNAFSSANIVANGFVRVSLSFGFFAGDDNTPFTSSTFRHGTLGTGSSRSLAQQSLSHRCVP